MQRNPQAAQADSATNGQDARRAPQIAPSAPPKRKRADGTKSSSDASKAASARRRRYPDKRTGRHGPVTGEPMGRPSKYSKAVGSYIVGQLALGRSLFDICDKDDHMPSRDTVMRWVRERPSFAELVSRGRTAGAEHSVGRIMDISETTTSKNARGNRIRLQAHMWLASKFHPALYADKAGNIDVQVNLDALVTGAYDLEQRRAPKLVEAEIVETKPLDVVVKPTK